MSPTVKLFVCSCDVCVCVCMCAYSCDFCAPLLIWVTINITQEISNLPDMKAQLIFNNVQTRPSLELIFLTHRYNIC